MVKLALPLAALAMAATVAAAPAPGTSGTTFSFQQWVEDLIANPETALSADEAIEAAKAADVVGSAGGLQKRVWCDNTDIRANGRDAARCVEYLARIGQQGSTCLVRSSTTEMCRDGNARIVGSKAVSSDQSANCNDIARTAGIIFDNCWRADDTINGAEICITNRNIQVNIAGVA
ncbi:hypothetical protein VTK26DRAFT_4776 [Humicola hyalothermophila]